MKNYKGYELIKAIAEGEIENGTRFREMEEGRYYIVKDRKLYEVMQDNLVNSELNNLQITYGIFELIEEEQDIDIQAIEEIPLGQLVCDVRELKINDLIKAVKQLDKKIKEDK